MYVSDIIAKYVLAINNSENIVIQKFQFPHLFLKLILKQ